MRERNDTENVGGRGVEGLDRSNSRCSHVRCPVPVNAGKVRMRWRLGVRTGDSCTPSHRPGARDRATGPGQGEGRGRADKHPGERCHLVTPCGRKDPWKKKKKKGTPPPRQRPPTPGQGRGIQPGRANGAAGGGKGQTIPNSRRHGLGFFFVFFRPSPRVIRFGWRPARRRK